MQLRHGAGASGGESGGESGGGRVGEGAGGGVRNINTKKLQSHLGVGLKSH